MRLTKTGSLSVNTSSLKMLPVQSPQSFIPFQKCTRTLLSLHPYVLWLAKDQLQSPSQNILISFLKYMVFKTHNCSNDCQLDSDVLLVTLDVASLYTCIPHTEGLQSIAKFLKSRDNSESPKDFLLELLNTVFTNNYFMYDDKVYLYTKRPRTSQRQD